MYRIIYRKQKEISQQTLKQYNSNREMQAIYILFKKYENQQTIFFRQLNINLFLLLQYKIYCLNDYIQELFNCIIYNKLNTFIFYNNIYKYFMVKLKVQYNQQFIFDGQASSFQDVQRAIETKYPEFQQGADYIYHKDPLGKFQELVNQMKRLNISSIKVKAYPKKLKDQIIAEQDQKRKLQKQKIQFGERKIKKIMENQYHVSHQNQHYQGNLNSGQTDILRFKQSRIYVQPLQPTDKVSYFKQSRVGFTHDDDEHSSNIRKTTSYKPETSENNVYSGFLNPQQYSSLKNQLQKYILELSKIQQQKQTQQAEKKQYELKSIIKQNVKQQIQNLRDELKWQIKQTIEKEFSQGAKIRQPEHREKDKGQLEQIKQQINKLKQHRSVSTNNYGSIQTNQTYNKIKEKISQEMSRQINKIKFDLEVNRNSSINKVDQTINAKMKQSIKRQLMDQMGNKNHYIDQQINLIKSDLQAQNKRYLDNFQMNVEQKIKRKFEQWKKKSIAKKNQQISNEYNESYTKIISMINQQQPNEIEQNENKAIEPSTNHKTIQNQRMTEDNPLINYRLQFEGIQKNNLKQQQKEFDHIQNNNDFQSIQNETKEPIQTSFEKQYSHNKHFSTFLHDQHSQIKMQDNQNIKSSIMESSLLTKIQSPSKKKKSQQKNKKNNNTKQLTLQQRRKQYSYKLVDTIQYVTLKPKENYTWTITLSNDGPDWEDQMIIMDKISNKPYKIGTLIENKSKRVQLGPFLQFKKGITQRQFIIGYKTKEGYRQIFHQIGDKFKLTVNAIEPGVTKQKSFEERINYLIKVYVQTKKIKLKPLQQILHGLQQVGITQKTFAESNEEVIVDLILGLHGYKK